MGNISVVSMMASVVGVVAMVGVVIFSPLVVAVFPFMVVVVVVVVSVNNRDVNVTNIAVAKFS